jgi:hypothetical protein
MREKRGKIVGKALIYSYLRGKKRKKKRAKKSLFVSIAQGLVKADLYAF